MLNALHSTPDLGPSCRELLTLILPHIHPRDLRNREALPFPMTLPARLEEEESSDDDDDDPAPKRRKTTAETIPFVSTGLYFTREARMGEDIPCPRLSHIPILMSAAACVFFFKEVHENLLNSVFRLGSGVEPNPNRISNKTRTTTEWYDQGQGLAADTFSLQEMGFDLPPPARDGGSDNEEFQPLDEPLGLDQDAGLDSSLTATWRQGLLDVTSKCCNQLSFTKCSYCILTVDERLLVNMTTYQNLNLSTYFFDCRYCLRRTAPKLWDIAFDNMFPPKGKAVSNGRQGYPNTQYMGMYMQLREGSDESVAAMRTALKAKFDQLEWFPFLQAGKMWKSDSKVDARFVRCAGNPKTGPAPYILIRTNVVPTW